MQKSKILKFINNNMRGIGILDDYLKINYSLVNYYSIYSNNFISFTLASKTIKNSKHV